MTKEERQKKLVPGSKWKHYKGGEYVVLMLARLEANQQDAVVYAQTQTEVRPTINWVRSVDNFMSFAVNAKGKMVHRFTPLE